MDSQIIFQLFLAAILGSLIGLEREIKRKGAGLQTYSLVALGACFFTVVALSFAELKIISDPAPIILAIALGTGFLGAGAISHGDRKTEGLTTAAGVWLTAAIGLAVGANFLSLALLGTFLALLILAGLGLIEEKVFKEKEQ
ncbi:MAG: magnesium transporter MgtC [Candidatus Tagabacteria bacterium CG09_land_8_20_14_0_10_41_14]|uniref:Magnesium transporter MgtC n=1 Tax=Candidatus Tagabacteria bacterium CG09_land_8_20_14_0_10_41_14 TaxID=1975021 RepID=A0A2H0WM46_9BACT|nr:MAG: magnesium transporter MgtC [Candidatus Tagabacteria bacterium CG09_land_8_20_14_0_10_41_14]